MPQSPVARTHPRNWTFRVKRTLDFLGHARPWSARFFRRANPYPKPFSHVWLRTRDGVDVAAWYGPPPDAGGADEAPSFGLVLVPGMFSTKDDTVHKRRALRVWRAWGIPVIVIDQRAFGESKGIATGGWKEAYDVLAAATYLRDHAGVEHVGVMAESLGGAAALNAAAIDAQEGTDLLGGGVLCLSAFVDIRDAVHYISIQPPRDHPFYYQWLMFRGLLRYRSMGGYRSFQEYMDDAARVNGLSGLDELAERANPKHSIARITVPTLLVHSTNDPIIPVRHARRVERYARDLENVEVLVTEWGGHTGFEEMDPWWSWEVLCRFFGWVNDRDLVNPDEALKGVRGGSPRVLRRFAGGGGGP